MTGPVSSKYLMMGDIWRGGGHSDGNSQQHIGPVSVSNPFCHLHAPCHQRIIVELIRGAMGDIARGKGILVIGWQSTGSALTTAANYNRCVSSPITLVLLLITSCLARSHPQYFPASSVQVISHIVYSRPFFINLTKNVIPAVAAVRRMRDMWPLAKARLLVTTLSFLTPLPPSKSIGLLFATH